MVNKFRNGTMDIFGRGANPVPLPVVTNINTATSSSGATCTMSLTVPAGATIFVLVGENAGTIGTLADATNGSYTAVSSVSFNAAADVGAIFVFDGSAALSGVTLTYTKHTTGDSVVMTAFYVSNVSASSVIDVAVTATATGSSTAPSVTGGTPGATNELVVGGVFCTGAPTYTQAGGFGATPSSVSVSTTLTVAGGSMFNNGSGTTTFAPTLGTSEPWAAIIVAITAVIPTTGAYTADGWIVVPTGAGVTAAQAAGRLLTKNSLQVTGATSVTDVKIKQRIESYIAAAFCSQTVTVQAQVYNGTGGSITPTLTVNRPSAQDNYGSVGATVSAASLQSCANGAWTQIAYTYDASPSSYNGQEIIFDFGNNFGANTKTVQITELDIRVTPGVATGLNSNPPPPELRHVETELAFCRRYFWQVGGVGNYDVIAEGFFYGTTYFRPLLMLPTPMRAIPTLIVPNPSTISITDGTSVFTPSALVLDGSTYSTVDQIGLSFPITGATAGKCGRAEAYGSTGSCLQLTAEL